MESKELRTVDQPKSQPEVKRIFANILVIFAALTLPGLPGLAWSLFGWLHIFLPLLIFFYLIKYGMSIGNKFILAGTGLALVAGMVTQSVDGLLFSCSLMPAGYVIAQSGLKGDSPALSGFKGAVTQSICWAILIALLSAREGLSPYGSLINAVHSSIDALMAYYSQSGAIDAEGMVMYEATLKQMKMVITLLLPSIFISCTFLSVWMTMVFGNRLAIRFCDRQIWPSYRYWQLPDKLIWVGICCAVLAFFPLGVIRSISANLLILLSVVYSFQGFSVCVFYMHKWNVPILFRSFVYVMVIFQSFGTIVLLVVGIADTWFDFRKLKKTEDTPETGPKDE